MSDARDRRLGMDRPITRRDFLDGVGQALTGSAAYLACGAVVRARDAGAQPPAAAYPPALTGMRGTHDGAWEVAHALRDGRAWDEATSSDTGERYDLVVVGGGISGLAAAYFYRKAAGSSARILVLDNHDDFGGHAKRNEFTIGGRLLIGYGGTQAIENRLDWSPVARGLRDELGIDTDRFFTAFDPDALHEARHGPGRVLRPRRVGRGSARQGRPGQPGRGAGAARWLVAAFAANAPFSERRG